MIDSHCHLDAEEFDVDRLDVVARARASGVIAQVIPAVTAAGWAKLKTICESGDGLFPAWGLHPMYLGEHRSEHLDRLSEWIERARPVAVGECGLDFHVDGLDPDAQRLYFDAQLKLARDHGLPVIVHARRAVDDVIAAIRRIGRLRGVVHSFSGSPDQARRLWSLGFMIGLGGPVTYSRATRLRKLVGDMPLEHLLLETDAPDQPDAAIRGERNEPMRLATICDTVAELRRASADEIAEATAANARRLFGLDAPAWRPASIAG